MKGENFGRKPILCMCNTEKSIRHKTFYVIFPTSTDKIY